MRVFCGSFLFSPLYPGSRAPEPCPGKPRGTPPRGVRPVPPQPPGPSPRRAALPYSSLCSTAAKHAAALRGPFPRRSPPSAKIHTRTVRSLRSRGAPRSGKSSRIQRHILLCRRQSRRKDVRARPVPEKTPVQPHGRTDVLPISSSCAGSPGIGRCPADRQRI